MKRVVRVLFTQAWELYRALNDVGNEDRFQKEAGSWKIE
jgi:hypothetical protein